MIGKVAYESRGVMLRELTARPEGELKKPREEGFDRGIEAAESGSDDSHSWMKFAGLVETGSPRSSQAIDEIVYGSTDGVLQR